MWDEHIPMHFVGTLEPDVYCHRIVPACIHVVVEKMVVPRRDVVRIVQLLRLFGPWRLHPQDRLDD